MPRQPRQPTREDIIKVFSEITGIAEDQISNRITVEGYQAELVVARCKSRFGGNPTHDNFQVCPADIFLEYDI